MEGILATGASGQVMSSLSPSNQARGTPVGGVIAGVQDTLGLDSTPGQGTWALSASVSPASEVLPLTPAWQVRGLGFC